MIIGDPNNFAVFIDLVTDWNDENSFWREGMIDFIFQCEFLSNKIKNFTINEFLTNWEDRFLIEPHDNKELFYMDKYQAYKYMLNTFNPLILNDDADWDSEYIETPHKYVFLSGYFKGAWIAIVSYQDKVRILAAIIHDLTQHCDEKGEVRGEWIRRENIIIREAFLNKKDYDLISEMSAKYLKKILPKNVNDNVPLF